MAGDQTMNPDVDSQAIEAYEEIVKWRKNIFMIPTGKIGKQFVQRMKDHIDSWCNEDKSGQMALKYVMIMPQILLQNPVRNPSACQIKETLERRLAMWDRGEISELVRECKLLQSRLQSSTGTKQDESNIKSFQHLMRIGKIHSALRLLDKTENPGLLEMNEDTLKLLNEKHPDAMDYDDTLVLNGPIAYTNSIIFESIDANMIRRIALKMKGSAGPSALDAEQWRRLLGTKLFGSVGSELCQSVANLTKKN